MTDIEICQRDVYIRPRTLRFGRLAATPGSPDVRKCGSRGELKRGTRGSMETYDNDDRNHQFDRDDWALAQSPGGAPDRGAGCKTASLRRELSETAGRGASEAAPSPGN